MSEIESFRLEKCSQCGNIHAVSSMYFNKKEGNLWCRYCLTLEKKKRNHQQWHKKKEVKNNGKN